MSELKKINGPVNIVGELEATSLDINGNADISGNITSAGWTGDVIASAYLDADTMHLSGTQTISGAKDFTSTANYLNGHLHFRSYDAAGNHYPHFLDGSSASGTTVNWRQYYGSSYKTHTWTSDASGNMGFTYQGAIIAAGSLTATGLDINGSADISGSLTTSNTLIVNKSQGTTALAINSAGNGGWTQYTSTNDGVYGYIGSGSHLLSPVVNDNDFVIRAQEEFAVSIAATEKMRINASGNATFAGTITGTTLTGTSLDINGDADISGDLTVHGKITQAGIVDFERYGRTYTVNVNAPLPLLTDGGAALPTGGAYRVTGHISGTGTEQVAMAVFWNENGTWYINKTFEGGTSSNHVEFKILNSVPTVTLETHTSNYNVHVYHERLSLEEGSGTDNLRGYFGSDSYLSWLESANKLTVPGDVTVSGGDLILGGTGRIQGIDTVSSGTDAASKAYVDGAVIANTDTQDLSISGQTLSLTNGGSVTIPTQTTVSGNAGTVTNGVYTTGNQTIGGIKEFTSEMKLGTYNSTVGGILSIHGTTANKKSTIKTTNGNLHVDSADGHSTYLNYYTGVSGAGQNVIFGSGDGGGSGAYVRGDGRIVGTTLQSTGAVVATSLDINGAANISGSLLVATATDYYSGCQIGVGDTGDSQNGLSITTSTTGNAYLLFGDGTGTSSYIGQIRYAHNGDFMDLQTGGAVRLKLNAAGATVTGKLAVSGEIEGSSLDINGNVDFDQNLTGGAFLDHKNTNSGSGAYTSIRIQNDTGNAEIWRNSSARSQTGGATQSLNVYNTQDTNIWSGGTRALHLDTSQNATFAGNITTGGSLISSNIIINQITSATTNGNINLRNNAGSNIVLFNNDLSTTFAGNVLFNENIDLPDGKSANFGTGDDLQIYHNGTDSYIDDAGAGDLRIRSNFLKIEKYTGETMATFNDDNAVSLYYNNAVKIATVTGGVNVTGTLTATADVIAYSDKRLKENVQTLDGKKVLEMRGVSFDRLDDGKSSSGVIAQELEKVAPELVVDDGDYKGVAYGNLVGYLIEAVKDQQKQIDELKAMINGNSK